METKQEQISYAVGLKAGADLRRQFHDLNLDSFKKGFIDAIEVRAPSQSDAEIEGNLKEFQNQNQVKQKILFEHLAKKNKQEGEKFLAENKVKPGVQSLSSGLQYKIIKAGNGKKPSRNDVVSVHYEGSLLGGHIFDSTYAKNAPAELVVNQTIPGFSEALKEMRVGDQWEVYIPWYLAYGENGYGQHIQPNATLIFKMELVKIK
jgi:FKBP-type peptidyl-prolyl cis-trans isomerase